MTPKSATLWLLGGAVGMVVLDKIVKAKSPGQATPIDLTTIQQLTVAPPTGLTPLPGAPAAVAAPAPVLVQANPIPLSAGQKYRVTLNTSGAATALANDARVVSEAQNRGFTNVVASQSKPAGWPGAANGNYYVTATYSGPPKTQARTESNLLGSVNVVEAWLG